MIIAGIVLSIISLFFLPWVVTALIAVALAFVEPLVPVSLGLLAEAVYYTGGMPWFALVGAILSFGSLFVRSRLRTGSMR